MVYVALLRGINVGGNSKVEMSKLKAALESIGLTDVTTYINSGNVVFTTKAAKQSAIQDAIAGTLHKTFGFEIPVVLHDLPTMETIAKNIPDIWTNDTAVKTDVLFLWEEVDNPKVLQQLTIKPGIDDVRYVAGAVVWGVDRTNATKSGLLKIIGTPLYKQMTIRNVNTLRKLVLLMQATQKTAH